MTSLESGLFFATLGLYALGALLFTLEFLQEGNQPSAPATGLTAVGFATHTATLAVRCAATGYPPMTNMYESLSLFAWGTVLAVLLARWRLGVPSVAAFAAPVYVVFMGLAYGLAPVGLPNLVPALKSWLLPAHVVLAFLGEAWFVVGFAAAVMFLVRDGMEKSGVPAEGLFWRRLPPARVLDTLSYRAISLGYPLFTLGALILGMLWAQRAWGRYWGWDPKENFALVTFLVYSVYLHGRLRWGWRGRTSAWLAIAGFAVTLFTLFGVNYLLRGLHSYATGGMGM